MLPTQDTAHVTEGLAMRLGQYLGAANLQALLTAFLDQVQDAEDMLWDVIRSQLLTSYAPGVLVAGTAQGQAQGPPPQALLQLADLVGCPVTNLTTAELAFLIPVWLLARKSHGTAEDLIGILAAAFGAGNFGYAEYYPAAYHASAWAVIDDTLIAPLAQALTIARPPGVLGDLAWGTEPTTTFFFGDSSAGGSPGSGLKNTILGDGAMGLLSSVGT